MDNKVGSRHVVKLEFILNAWEIVMFLKAFIFALNYIFVTFCNRFDWLILFAWISIEINLLFLRIY